MYAPGHVRGIENSVAFAARSAPRFATIKRIKIRREIAKRIYFSFPRGGSNIPILRGDLQALEARLFFDGPIRSSPIDVFPGGFTEDLVYR